MVNERERKAAGGKLHSNVVGAKGGGWGAPCTFEKQELTLTRSLILAIGHISYRKKL